MPATDADLHALDALLDQAVLLGAELDPNYRVLGLTIDVAPDRHPGQPAGGDHRLQVLLHPAGTIEASLRRRGDETVVEAFTVDQLPDVVHALDGPVLTAPIVGEGPVAPGEWGPAMSLQGRSNAPDGHRHRLRFDVTAGDREFGLHVTFDEVEVRGPDGQGIALT